MYENATGRENGASVSRPSILRAPAAAVPPIAGSVGDGWLAGQRVAMSQCTVWSEVNAAATQGWRATLAARQGPTADGHGCQPAGRGTQPGFPTATAVAKPQPHECAVRQRVGMPRRRVLLRQVVKKRCTRPLRYITISWEPSLEAPKMRSTNTMGTCRGQHAHRIGGCRVHAAGAMAAPGPQPACCPCRGHRALLPPLAQHGHSCLPRHVPPPLLTSSME